MCKYQKWPDHTQYIYNLLLQNKLSQKIVPDRQFFCLTGMSFTVTLLLNCDIRGLCRPSCIGRSGSGKESNRVIAIWLQRAYWGLERLDYLMRSGFQSGQLGRRYGPWYCRGEFGFGRFYAPRRVINGKRCLFFPMEKGYMDKIAPNMHWETAIFG